MKPRSLADIAQLIGGELLAPEAAGITASGAAIDSRLLRSGDLFFAIEAERDGHDFAANALDAGAVAAVVKKGRSSVVAGPAIEVADPRRALGQLATAIRELESNTPAVAITGSIGKTTTCGYVAALLAPLGPVYRPPGSFNNDLGVPLTILGAPKDTAALVLELGSNAPGEIAPLAKITGASVGLVTAIAPAHLAELIDLAGVAREKLSLFGALPAPARGWVPTEYLAPAREQRAAVESFGEGGASHVVTRGRGRARWFFRGESYEFTWTPTFRHQRALLAAALAVAAEFGLEPETLLELVPTLPEPPLRGEVRHLDGIDLILDCYNSSPAALRSSLERLEDERALGRRLCVLGTMEELGRDEAKWHRDLGRRAGSRKIDRIFVAGRGRTWYREGLSDVGREGVDVDLGDEGARAIANCLLPGDRVLFKASRKERLERFADRIAHYLSLRAELSEGNEP